MANQFWWIWDLLNSYPKVDYHYHYHYYYDDYYCYYYHYHYYYPYYYYYYYYYYCDNILLITNYYYCGQDNHHLWNTRVCGSRNHCGE